MIAPAACSRLRFWTSADSRASGGSGLLGNPRALAHEPLTLALGLGLGLFRLAQVVDLAGKHGGLGALRRCRPLRQSPERLLDRLLPFVDKGGKLALKIRQHPGVGFGPREQRSRRPAC